MRPLPVVVALLACVLAASAEELNPNANSPAVSQVELTKHGWVNRRGCNPGAKCAALGNPYRYNVYHAADIETAALSAIQEVGFSFNPDMKDYSFSDCKLLEQDQNRKASNLALFWTDFILLDEKLLTSLSLTWSDVGIIADDTVTYRVRVMGCHYRFYDGSLVPFTTPEAVQKHYLGNDYGLYQTTIKLIMTLVMQSRGTKSAFTEVGGTVYSPKKFLDRVKLLIDQKLAKLPPTQYPTDNSGKVKL